MSLFEPDKIKFHVLTKEIKLPTTYIPTMSMDDQLIRAFYGGYPFAFTMYTMITDNSIDLTSFDCDKWYLDDISKIHRLINGTFVHESTGHLHPLKYIISSRRFYKINEKFNVVVETSYQYKTTTTICFIYKPRSDEIRPTRIYIRREKCLVYIRDFIRRYY